MDLMPHSSMDNTKRVLQNRYQVEGLIGAGGMGSVYLAIDNRFGTKVAIKETVSADERMRRAFEHEAQLLNSLRHPALPRVVDYFVQADGQFIVMEYIAGEDLSEILKRKGSFKLNDVLRWADDLLDALQYLHTQKSPVIHRDIKPQNLKLTPSGAIILLDFGLAKGNPSDLSHLTMAKSIFGYSRSYASLEQIQGTGTDPRSDLYSLSATLYHLLTGQPTVDALTRAKAVLNGEPDSLQSINSFDLPIPATIAEVLHQGLALNANLRPHTAIDMRVMLKRGVLHTEHFRNPEYVEDSSDDTQISPQNIQLGNNQTNNIFNAKGNLLLDGKNVKLNYPSQQSDKEKQSFSIKSKKTLHPWSALAIAAVILAAFGGAAALFKTQTLSFRLNNSNNLPSEPAPISNIVAKEEVSAADAASLPIITQDNVQTTADVGQEETVADQKTIVTHPLITNREPEKTIRLKAKSSVIKPLPDGAPAAALRQKDSVGIKREPLKQTVETIVIKPEIKSESQKRNGFKGFLNKIGSGAMSIPKSIFKKKKD